MEAIANALADVPSTTLWAYSLVAGVVVILIVAVLLIGILVTARKIDYHANAIWEAGKRIAANTVSIWMLDRTNAVASSILSTAVSIVGAAESIDKRLAGLGEALGRKGG